MGAELRQQMIDVAREYVRAPVGYTFSQGERSALEPFFTNADRRVFFFQNLPANVVSALLAMYSRQKNPRGIRGHFVDNLLPVLFRTDIGDEPGVWKRVQREYRDQGLDTLDKVLDSDGRRRFEFAEFLNAAANPDFWSNLSGSARVREFLEMWLDKFGHNSIARTGQLVFGVEDISILAAKSLEWGRPGSGYIELSTRYVDFSGKATYPIERELALIDEQSAKLATQNIGQGLALYQALMGENVDGPFPSFLRERWGSIIDERSLDAGVLGESCDVLGNLLPCTTLTQVGVSVSGESYPELIKHLLLDDTPENDALAELILEEGACVGGNQFIHHMDISEWRRAGWSYVHPDPDVLNVGITTPLEHSEFTLWYLLTRTERFRHCRSWDAALSELTSLERSPFDKLPRAFEHLSATFGGAMSFRGWRDLHRQGFCAHHRSLVTPLVGFYSYPKPAPPALSQSFDRIAYMNERLWRVMHDADVPGPMRQYAMAMGNLVSYLAGANLRQWEFCDWQRTKGTVNDEVRQQFLDVENDLRGAYPWWAKLSRADMTYHYVFARGSELVPLPMAQ